MFSCGLPAICLGPTGNFQGSYHFLNLATRSVIKCRTFDELPAPQSVIDRVTALAAKSGVSSNLIFANRRQVPFEWSTKDASAPPITPVAPYPDIPAKMLGVLISRHQTTQDAPPVPPRPHEPDWEQMADKAVDNAGLELTELLPPPPKVITIDNDDNNYQVPVVPLTSQLPVLPKVEPTSNPPPTTDSTPTYAGTFAISHPNPTHTTAFTRLCFHNGCRRI